MVLRKLKFLLKPPIPLLLVNGVALVIALLISRATAWGIVIYALYSSYLYVARVRGRGEVGWTFVTGSLIALVAVRGLEVDSGAYIASIIAGGALVLFLSAIEYRITNSSRALQISDYLTMGLGVWWWMTYTMSNWSMIMPLIFFGVVYVRVRDRIRFVEHQWNKERALWYLVYAYIAAQYAWILTLFPLATAPTTALFLVFYIITDELVVLGRTESIDKKTALLNAAWYIGSSVVIFLIGYGM